MKTFVHALDIHLHRICSFPARENVKAHYIWCFATRERRHPHIQRAKPNCECGVTLTVVRTGAYGMVPVL